MKLLLDTHILIWYFDGDRRLSIKARETIDDNRNIFSRCEKKSPLLD